MFTICNIRQKQNRKGSRRDKKREFFPLSMKNENIVFKKLLNWKLNDLSIEILYCKYLHVTTSHSSSLQVSDEGGGGGRVSFPSTRANRPLS